MNSARATSRWDKRDRWDEWAAAGCAGGGKVIAVFIEQRVSVAGVRVSDEVQLDVAHSGDEALQAFVGIVEQCVPGNHQFPMAVPHGAANEPVVRVLRAHERASVAIEARAEITHAG